MAELIFNSFRVTAFNRNTVFAESGSIVLEVPKSLNGAHSLNLGDQVQLFYNAGETKSHLIGVIRPFLKGL